MHIGDALYNFIMYIIHLNVLVIFLKKCYSFDSSVQTFLKIFHDLHADDWMDASY